MRTQTTQTSHHPASGLTMAVVSLAALFVLGGCTNTPIKPDRTNVTTAPSEEATASRSAAEVPPRQRFANDSENRYLRLDASKTGIQNVADDGQNTFVLFAQVPAAIEVFNQDGKPVRHANSKTVLAIEGIHQGLLFKNATGGTSFAAPNPHAPHTPPTFLLSDADVAEARSMLEGEGAHKAAYERLLAITQKPVNGAKAVAAPNSSAQPIVITTPPPTSANDDATYLRQTNGVLMRVFFASGGRSIVRPDDGLSRLAQEATNAQQIRITGYTDNLGKASTNSALAQQRAEAIRNHLVKSGISAERILMSWTGATDFMAENVTEKGRAMNRRVEVQMMQQPVAARN